MQSYREEKAAGPAPLSTSDEEANESHLTLGSPTQPPVLEFGDPHHSKCTFSEGLQKPSWQSLVKFTTWGQLPIMLLAFLLAAISGAIVPVLAILLGKLFNNLADFGAGCSDSASLLKDSRNLIIAMAFLAVATWVFNGGFFMLWIAFGELQAKTAREIIFRNLMQREVHWFDSQANGITATLLRVQMQVRELQLATSQPLGLFIQHIMAAVTALGVAFYYSWALSFVTLASFPLLAATLAFVSSKMQPSIDRQALALASASKIAATALSAIETVKLCNGQALELRKYKLDIRRACSSYLVQANLNAAQVGLVRLATLSMFVQGFWYGSTLIDSKSSKKNAGQVLTTFWACLIATQAIQQLLPQLIVLEKGKAAAAALGAVVNNGIHNHSSGLDSAHSQPKSCKGDITFRNVSFAYPSRLDQPTLTDLNLSIPAGRTTFIVGRSGSGKSTLGNLLLRFHDPTSGNITLDGQSLGRLNLEWIRRNIALVQQQTILFNESLLINILFGALKEDDVSNDVFDEALELGMLNDTLKGLSKGLDTIVGEKGNSLSGGQKQRVALARAYLRDSPVLILDESTNALDYTSRSTIMKALRQWRRNKTTLIITHDVSQIQGDDLTVVMDMGKIVQHGPRHTLDLKVEDLAYPSEEDPAEMPQPSASILHDKRIKSLDASEPVTTHSPEPIQISATVSQLQKNFSLYQKNSISPKVAEIDSQLSPMSSPVSQICSPIVQSGRDSIPLISYPAGVHKEAHMDAMAHTNNPLNRRSIRKRLWTSHKGRRPNQKLRCGADVSSIRNIIATVWPTLDPRHRWLLILGFLCATIYAVMIPLFCYVFTQLLSTFFLPQNKSKEALRWSLAVLGVAIADSISSYLMFFLFETCGQNWIDTLRTEAFRRVLDQPRAWFDRVENLSCKTVQCLDRNAEEMRNLVGRFIGLVYVAILMMTVALAWSLGVSWRLTLVGLACAPMMYAITRSFEWTTGRLEGEANETTEEVGTILVETFANIRTVRALLLERHFEHKHSRATKKTFLVGTKKAVYSGFLYGLSESAMIFVTALVCYYGVFLASRSSSSVTQVLLVLTMLLFSISNASLIIGLVPQISSSRDTATKLLRLATLPCNSHEHTGDHRVTDCTPIAFANVNFAYSSRHTTPVLRGLNLKISQGAMVAVVGSSGSGKSTLAAMLTRIYTPEMPDSISMAGQSLSSINITSLRDNITMVHQVPFLFPGTIRENIVYGLSKDMITSGLAESAAKSAGIHDFISSLADGYGTTVGDGSQGLSGGQAQRIVIARALARRPKVLILDEATSSLDGESARIIRESILKMARSEAGVTIIAITHDWRMMKIANQVAVVDRGRVVEEGTFNELLLADGWLSNLLQNEASFHEARLSLQRRMPSRKGKAKA